MEDYVKYSKIYRTYAEVDLLNLEYLEELIQEAKPIPDLHIDLMLTTFNSQSLFNIFEGKLVMYQAISDSLERYYQVTEATPEEEEQIQHIMKQVFLLRYMMGKYQRKPRIRDTLLKIAMMCEHTQIKTFCHH